MIDIAETHHSRLLKILVKLFLRDERNKKNKKDLNICDKSLLVLDEDNLNSMSNSEKLNIIMKLLRSSSSRVNQYYSDFKDFFANNKPEEDLHEQIQTLEREIIECR